MIVTFIVDLTLRMIYFMNWFLIGLQVNKLFMYPDQLSTLDNDVIDQLVPKINERVEVRRYRPPSDEVAYNEKLDYLRSVARSRGGPVC